MYFWLDPKVLKKSRLKKNIPSFLLKEKKQKFKAENIWLRISLAALKRINSPARGGIKQYSFFNVPLVHSLYAKYFRPREK